MIRGSLHGRRRSLVLGAYLSYGTGHHAASWRHPETVLDGAQSIEHHVRLAQIAERGLFDLIFLSDTPSVFNDDAEGHGGRVVVLEPLTALAAIAMRTNDIGLVATSSTTYKEPYNLAREYASLDFISGGRAAWNLVTTSKGAAAFNFGSRSHLAHADRYRRASEFFDVVCGLWDSWDDDALVRDRESGLFYVPERRHRLDHHGEFFSVRGELNVARPPQGHPVIVQAGSSERGRELAARTAEVVFTAQPDPDRSRAFIDDLKRRLGAYDRTNPDVIVMPGLSPFLGATRAEAQAKFDHLQSLIHPRLGLSMLSDLLGGFDLSDCDIDGPLPELPPSNGNTSRRALIERMARGEGLTIRQIYERMIVSRGHAIAIGSYREVAELIAEWFDTGAADGFNIMPPLFPQSLQEFVDHVVPELQRMGIHKTAYRPGTLRDKLGLRRPPSRFAVRRDSDIFQAHPQEVASSA